MSNSYNLQEINQEKALNLCQFYIRAGQNMLMVGPKGIGKTHLSIQSALKCGFKLSYVNLSVLERPDLAGFPILNDNSDVINFKSPHYLPPLKEGQKPDIVILFDEIDKCSSDLWAPLLEILQFRTINGKKINCVACILTGNLMSESKSYSNEISGPLLDRCSKYILSFDFNVWLKWAQESVLHPLVLGFLSSNQDAVIGAPEATEWAVPTPRGWEFVSKALIRAGELKITDIDTITSIVAGFVGENAAIRFSEWYSYSRHLEKFLIPLIENGFCNIEYHKLEPTEQLVFAIMACYLAKNKVLEKKGKKRLKHLEHLCNFFLNEKVAPEVQLLAMSNAFSFDLIVKEKLYECDLFLKMHKELTDSANEIK